MDIFIYLTYCAVPSRLYMVFALITSVDKSVLALGMKFH